jgi:PAS domain S-box-containing protein
VGLPKKPAVDGPALHKASLILMIGVLVGALALAGVMLTREHGRIAALWLPNAVLTAILLRRRHGSDHGYILAGLAGNIIANLIAGDTLDRAAGLSICNSLEMLLVTWGTRWLCGRFPDMSDLGHLMKFSLIGGLIAPAITGLFACIVLRWPQTAPDFSLWISWATADGLGMLIVAPVLMIFIDAWRDRSYLRSRSRTDWILILSGGGLVAAVPFAGVPFPSFFIAGPFLILAAFRLGTLGTAIAVVMVSCAATAATASGHGFMRFLDPDLFSRLVVLQGFLAATFGMSLPVAAALAGRDRLREELNDSRIFVGSILDNMSDVVFRTDVRGRWIFLNPAWTQLTGRSVKDSIGIFTPRTFHRDDIAILRTLWPDIVTGRAKDVTMPLRVMRPGGECRHVEVSTRRIVDDHGRFGGTTGTVRDVTERRRTEHELAARDRQLDLLAKNATDAVLRLSLRSNCLYASPSSRDILHQDPGGLIGKNITKRIHPADRSDFLARYRELADGVLDRSVITFRSVAAGQNGGDIWLEANCGLVRSTRGRPREVIASIRDITVRKELELELERARQQAEAADKSKSTFLANMSHEIRTPMHGVMGFTELLLASHLDETQRRYVQLISDSGSAMMRLLSDILDISKVEAGHMKIANEAVDVAQTLDACVKLLTPTAEQKGLDLRLVLDPHLPSNLAGDGLRLSQIVLNLLGNGLKFTQRGSVTLSAALVGRGDEAMLEIAVTDTGIGISTKHQQHIFDQFMQVGQAEVSRETGAGLGLAISSQLARLMGGEISLQSEPGKGSTFFLRIPARLTIEKQTAVSFRHASGRPATPGGARILVAEDNSINQALLESMLGGFGYECRIVSNGREAVAAATTGSFDLVLMDIRMPELNGLDACREIRQLVPADRLPIVAMTANAYPEDVQACLDAGMQEELVKPIRIPAMEKAIRRWLGAGPAMSQSAPAPIDPGLDAKYRARKEDTLRRLDSLIRQGKFSGTAIEELANVAHQLAGVAAMFDEPDVGESAARIVETLEGMPLIDREEPTPAFRSTLRELHRSMSQG